ncbi:MAG: maleylpyruvate isomerase family mycothiol-dependent enzyme, partial [Terriglobales bacterium]
SKPVPSCPGWTMHDLVNHLGRVYQRLEIYATSRGARPSQDRLETIESGPPGPEMIDWWDGKLASLMTTLTALDPGEPAWNWSHKPHVAAFFQRRAAHETAIHRWDAQLSVSLPDPIDPPELAADGVDEALDTFLPSDSTVAERIRVTGVARLVATDIDAHWVIRARENGIILLDTGGWFDNEPQVAAVAEGTASDLLLALWGRIPLSVLDTRGEAQLLEQLLIHRVSADD